MKNRSMLNRSMLNQTVIALLAAAATLPGGGAYGQAVARPALRVPGPALAAALRDALRDVGAEARARFAEQPEATGPLQAAVMEVNGRVEWRADEERPWRQAAVDDLLDPGARIRTGRDSTMTLRVGHNATVMIESHTRMALPRVLRDGETLRTLVEVSRGRANIKVDRVGLTNDFSVVTPSGTLAVRGTGFAVSYGGLEGTRIEAARFNDIASIEVRYFLERFAMAVSARAITTDRHPNPAVARLFRGFGPPRIISAVVEAGATPELLMATMGSQARRGRRLDLARMGVVESIENILPTYGFDEHVLMQFNDPLTLGEIADFICTYLGTVFYRYAMILDMSGLGTHGLTTTLSQVQMFCDDHNGPFGPGDLQEIVNIIVSYCVDQHAPSQHDVARCIKDFYKAVVDQYNGGV